MTVPETPRAFFRPSAFECFALVLGAILVVRYAWLMDDAFVFFRYADNALFLGNGLVYNAGEAVEGYSSPAWMLLLLLLRAPGWDFWIVLRVLGVVIWFCTWWALCLLGRRASPRGGPATGGVALAYLAGNYGFLCYFTSGIETPLVQLSAVLFALHALRPESRVLQLALAWTPLVRHEFVLPLLMSWGMTWWRGRRFPWALSVGATVLGLGWLIFRVDMYADLVPNTFHLKDRTDYAQGLRYLWDTAGTYQAIPFGLLVLVCAGIVRRRSDRERDGRDLALARWWMVALALPVAIYAIRVGGDARHYRYLAFPFVLLVCASSGLVEGTLAGRRFAALVPWGVLGGVFWCVPPQLDGHPALGRAEHTQVAGINDAEFHRYHEDIALDAFRSRDPLAKYEAFLQEGRGYRGVFTNGRCVQIWRGFDLRWIHWHGLTDAVLARVEMDPSRPGHKPGLRPLAADLSAIYAREREPGVGMYRRAVEDGIAADWIVENLTLFEELEARLYGERSFWESLRLALRPIGRIRQ